MEHNNFYKRIALLGNYIPKGKVVSYGQIALLCGYPKNSRQVGYALKKKKAGITFPAYRVVNSQGYLTGAACFETPGRQKELLEADGIIVNDGARVDLKKYGWHHTLADAEMLYTLFKQQNI